jgi:menaquinone-9 beta-reductase
MRATTDVLVIGGGPAGLAAAIALRQRGVGALLIDAQSPAIDKACGEGLMPGALAALRRLGVEIAPGEGQPFHGIRFCGPEQRVEARFPHQPGLGIRRTRLHAGLAECAAAAGVAVRWNTRCTLLGPNTASLAGEEVRFRYLIGADGQASQVRGWSGLQECARDSLRYGFRRHYQVEPWSDLVEVHWGEHGQLYVTPVDTDCVCIAFVSRNKSYDHEAVMAGFPEVARRIEGCVLLSQQRGGLSATRRLREVARGSVALVGDASGSVDAVTGDGLTLCFEQAEAVAAAIAHGSLERYAAAHRAIGRLPYRMGALLLLMDRFPSLASRALRTLAARPEYFRELLAVHVGERTLLHFALREGPRLGWGLLTA